MLGMTLAKLFTIVPKGYCSWLHMPCCAGSDNRAAHSAVEVLACCSEHQLLLKRCQVPSAGSIEFYGNFDCFQLWRTSTCGCMYALLPCCFSLLSNIGWANMHAETQLQAQSRPPTNHLSAFPQNRNTYLLVAARDGDSLLTALLLKPSAGSACCSKGLLVSANDAIVIHEHVLHQEAAARAHSSRPWTWRVLRVHG